MLDLIKTNIIQPLAGRIGTMTATLLVTHGVGQDLATQVGIGVTAVGLIVADLALSYVNRRRQVADAVAGK